MHRWIAGAVLIGVLMTAAPAAATPPGPCNARWFVSIKPRLGPARIERRVTKLIHCAVRAWPVAGGASQALCIAHRESGPYLWPWADSGSSKGTYQLNERYFRNWRDRYLQRRWFPKSWGSPHMYFNARANVLTGIHMAHAGGWGPWSGSC